MVGEKKMSRMYVEMIQMKASVSFKLDFKVLTP